MQQQNYFQTDSHPRNILKAQIQEDAQEIQILN